MASAQVVFVAVGTHDGNGGWQTATIRTALSSIVPEMADDSTLVVRSTLPPTSSDSSLARQRDPPEAGRAPIPVMTNPEFTREGSAVRDFLQPDRVVIGVGDDPHGRGASMLRKVYRRTNVPILVMGATDAALTKLGANLFLATKISFANELAQLCDAYGADITHVVAGMSHDNRIGGGFLRPGIGFGGSCLPHQVSMTVRESAALGLTTPLFAAVEEINHRQRQVFLDRITIAAGGLEGAHIALLGLTFKPDTDDLREAPALEIASALIERGATVVAYDPMPAARAKAAREVPGLVVVDRAMKAIVGADAIGLVTEWPEFPGCPGAPSPRPCGGQPSSMGGTPSSPSCSSRPGSTMSGSDATAGWPCRRRRQPLPKRPRRRQRGTRGAGPQSCAPGHIHRGSAHGPQHRPIHDVHGCRNQPIGRVNRLRGGTRAT